MVNELPPNMRQTIEQQGGLSKDTRALMLYEANSRSVLVAYLLWFFLARTTSISSAQVSPWCNSS
jgi:hypothetical protein